MNENKNATKDHGGFLEARKNAHGRVFYVGRVRLQDGTLSSRFEIPELRRWDKEKSRAHVAAEQEQENKTHARYNEKLVKGTGKPTKKVPVAVAAAESSDAWYVRFTTVRRDEVAGVDDDRRRWNKWVSPHIGAKPIMTVDPDDIENIRDALSAAVIAYETFGNVKGPGRLAPKTAKLAWSVVTTAFKYASTRKGPRELRVREAQGNPCAGIEPPRDGPSKSRHWCRPGEILAVVSCAEVPREWREAIAVGSYLHLRPGELHELRIKDLDLDSGEVHIARAYDERKKKVTTPKTEEGIRHVTIPNTLMPLLRRIARNGSPEDRVTPIVAGTEEYFRANLFRSYLVTANVKRAELFVETATHLMIDFRSLRDSGITWRFLAGHEAVVVQREAGHEQLSTTLRYAKEVHARGGRFGEPFPALPADLIEPGARPLEIQPQILDLIQAAKNGANRMNVGWAERDLNPRPTD